MEYSGLATLRTLPNYVNLRQRFTGPRLAGLETSLAQLGIQEGDIDELLLGWKTGAKEMELYGRLVSPGSYLIVEDTDINGHPVMPNYGPGPHEAVVEYQKNHPGEFVIDKSREKMGFTCFPDGFLKRVK